jgi:hypothetical protein
LQRADGTQFATEKERAHAQAFLDARNRTDAPRALTPPLQVFVDDGQAFPTTTSSVWHGKSHLTFDHVARLNLPTDRVLTGYRQGSFINPKHKRVADLRAPASVVLGIYPNAGPFYEEFPMFNIIMEPDVILDGRNVAALPPRQFEPLYLPIDIFQRPEPKAGDVVVVFREVVLRGATKGVGRKDSGRGQYGAYSRYRLRSKEDDRVWEASPLSITSGSRDSHKRTHFTPDEFISIIP